MNSIKIFFVKDVSKKNTYDTGRLVGLNAASDFRFSFYFHPMLYVVFKSKAKK